MVIRLHKWLETKRWSYPCFNTCILLYMYICKYIWYICISCSQVYKQVQYLCQIPVKKCSTYAHIQASLSSQFCAISTLTSLHKFKYHNIIQSTEVSYLVTKQYFVPNQSQIFFSVIIRSLVCRAISLVKDYSCYCLLVISKS